MCDAKAFVGRKRPGVFAHKTIFLQSTSTRELPVVDNSTVTFVFFLFPPCSRTMSRFSNEENRRDILVQDMRRGRNRVAFTSDVEIFVGRRSSGHTYSSRDIKRNVRESLNLAV